MTDRMTFPSPSILPHVKVDDRISAVMDKMTSFDESTKASAEKNERIRVQIRTQDLETANVQNELKRINIFSTQVCVCVCVCLSVCSCMRSCMYACGCDYVSVFCMSKVYISSPSFSV